MNLITPLFGGALLVVFTAIQTWINSGRFDRLETDIKSVRADLGDEISVLRQEIASLRSDLLHVALDRRRDD
jgi:hypothetical protein